jgi:predicted regulator of Ras-like GTPase activity (Roadblock/LC7/MglB family)
VLVRASADDMKPPPSAPKEALGKPERLARPSGIDVFRAAAAKERQGARAASQSRFSTPSTPVKSFMTQERKATPLVPEPAPANKDQSPIEKLAVTPFPLRGLKEKTVSRVEDLNRVLRKLQSDSAGIEASALISEDGRMIANAVAPSMEESRVAGMAATLLSLGTRAAAELRHGGMREVIVGGELGYVVLMSAGCGALLLAMTSEIDKLGLIYFNMQEAIRGVQKIL